jgi:hypothetical protein
MNSKLKLVGATSALLVSFACGCAAEAGSDESAFDEATPVDEKTATDESALVNRNNWEHDKNTRNSNAHETNPQDRGDDRFDYRRNPPGYNPPGYNPYHPGYNPPGYNPPGRGPGYAPGYGRRYNPPGYNPPGYNPYAPGYNPPGYNPPGYNAPGVW